MYSIVSRRSFDMVGTIRDKLLNAVGTEDIPHVLVGNKSDLVHEREVQREEGQALAEEWGVPFIECSAKYNMNIEEIFQRLIAHTEARSEGGDGDKKCVVM
jgi:Ras family protein